MRALTLSKHMGIWLLLSTLPIFLFGCVPWRPVFTPPQPPPVDEFQCEAAVVFLFDISGSMEDDVAPGETLLQRLTSAAVSVVEVVPSGQWNMGLYTFAENNNAQPWWGMSMLTDANRQSLIDALESLTPSGGSDIRSSLPMAGLLLVSDANRRRFLVVFSDGEICYEAGPLGGPGTCDEVRNQANALKNDWGITIKTIGYNLDDEQQTILRDMASPMPDSSGPAFINTGSADELYRLLVGNLAEICDFFEVDITTSRSVFSLGSDGGIGPGEYDVHYLQGEARDVQLLGAGPFIDALGSVLFSPPTGHLSPTSPSFHGKIEVHASPNISAGSYDLTLKVVPVGGNLTLDSKTVQVTVIPFTMDVSILGPSWNGATESIDGRVRMVTDAGQASPLTISYLVRDEQGAEAPGFYSNPGNVTIHTAPQGADDKNFQFRINWSGPPDAPAPGSYSVHVVVTAGAVGVSKEASATVVVP